MIHPELRLNPATIAQDVARETPAAVLQRTAPIAMRRKVRRPRMLLLSCIYDFSYRVMRCAHEAGGDVYVLGNVGAKGFRFSRCCEGVFFSDHIIDGGRNEDLALEINWYIHELGIDWLLAGDAPSARSLIANKDLLDARCFPTPTLEQFDELNDKWRFRNLCCELGIACPETWLYPQSGSLLADLEAGKLALPVIAKPLSFDNSRAQVLLLPNDFRHGIKRIRFRPVLAQQFIDGEDIGASVYARDGEIYAFVAHRLANDVYRTFDDRRIYSDILTIVRHLKLSGVFNFDMRLTADNEIYYLECNPRFFFKMDLSMLAGINFVSCGLSDAELPAPVPAGVDVRLPKALLRNALWPHRWRSRDIASLQYLVSDPLPLILQRLRLI